MTISTKIENHADPNGAFICIKKPIEIHGRNAFTLLGSYQTLVSVRRLNSLTGQSKLSWSEPFIYVRCCSLCAPPP